VVDVRGKVVGHSFTFKSFNIFSLFLFLMFLSEEQYLQV